MDKLRLKGGKRLEGQVRIGGAKNAALPALAASLLTPDEVILENIPLVNDIFTTRRLLRELGVAVEFESDHSVRLRAAKILSHEAPYDLVKTIPRYYSNGVDALVLRKDLLSASEGS